MTTKSIFIFSILLCAVAMPSFAELTDADLDKIRLIVNESEKRVKEETKKEVTSSEARMKQYIDLKIEGVNGRITGIEGRFTGMEKQLATLTYLVYALIALIVITVGIPQIIMTLRDSSNRERDRKIEQLTREIETLKQQRIVKP